MHIYNFYLTFYFLFPFFLVTTLHEYMEFRFVTQTNNTNFHAKLKPWNQSTL